MLLACIVFLTSCGAVVGNDTTSRHERADALNEQAYKKRYVSLAETEHLAEQALQLSGDYSDGQYEALCHQAFVLSMRTDYAGAKRLYRQVTKEAKNELFVLLADIGLMDLSQRTSSNKEYYDYRNDAQRRLNRLSGSVETMNAHQLRLWNYATSEYHFVSAVYYFYMNQRHEAAAEMLTVTNNTDCIRNDTGQIAKYCYLTGSGGLIESGGTAQTGSETDDIHPTSKEENRNLMRCLSISTNKGITFFLASALQSCADNILNAPDQLDQKDILVLAEYVGADYNDRQHLPLALARRSYQLLTDYGCPFSASAALITIADYYIGHGKTQQALDTLQAALDIINRHHLEYSGSTIGELRDQRLVPYDSILTQTSTEKQWIESHDESVNPLWMSSVREYLSICYSAMGDKAAADYNRNIYLDILDATRQDMEIESRYDKLSAEERTINILLVSLFVILLLLVSLFVLYYRRQLMNKQRRKDKLVKLFDICKKMMASVPTDAEDADDIRQAIDEAVSSDIHRLFPSLPIDLRLSNLSSKDDLQQVTTPLIGNYDRELLNVIRAFHDWLIANGKKVITLNNRMQMTESRRYVHEMHVQDNKRANIDKQACMSVVLGITPYIDRMANELNRLANSKEDSGKRADRLRYVEELVDKINADNEILVHWIKMSQGTLSLNIEVFALQPLFELFAKNRSSFVSKGIQLEVEPTTSTVRADRALTIFMVNTLLDNALKYTPEGGTVTLSATEDAEAVDIAVSDTGRGLSADDIRLICSEKVYDASRIGMSEGTDQESMENNRELSKQKGFGFGLMNCRGIIEKYRKTNKLFSVCRFYVESEPGQGSRFHFTLPKGASRAVKSLLLFFIPLICSCTGIPSDSTTSTPMPTTQNPRQESTDSLLSPRLDSLVSEIQAHVDNVYYNNVDGYYEDALLSADSAITALNTFHRLLYPEDKRKMQISYDHGTPTELDWYKEDHDMAYSTILDLRNETAVAALALCQWDLYHSNNDTYTRMYRLVGEDKSLEQTCNNLQMANINKQTVLVVLIVLVALSLLLFFILYYKFYLLNILNMEQYISFSKHVLSTDYNADNETLDRSLVADLFRGFSDVKLLDGMVIVVNSDNGKGLLTAVSEGCRNEHQLIEQAKETYSRKAKPERPGSIIAYPLTVSEEGEEQTLGAIALDLHGGTLSDDEEIIIRLMVQLTSIYLNSSLVQLNIRTNDIELMEDEERRALHEENAVHVQNMILDNCLSTIKHETMYYPNRIKQLLTARDKDETLDVGAVQELAGYYRDIYGILSANALRQVSGKTFRRASCASHVFADYARRQFSKMKSKGGTGITFTIGFFTNDEVICDKDLLEYLIDNLLHHAFDCHQAGGLLFEAVAEERFVAFRFSDLRQTFTQEELNSLFYPETIRYDARTDRLQSTHLIVCKQIVREHDEHSPYRGCRIFAEPVRDGTGYTIVFTIPRKRTKK